MAVKGIPLIKWVSVLSLAIACIVQVQGYCYTQWGSRGRCLNLKKCESMRELLLRQRPPPQIVLNVLKRSNCGYEGLEPKVCCEIIETYSPNNGNQVSKIGSKKMGTEETMAALTETTETPTPSVVIPVNHHRNRRLLNDTVCGSGAESRIYNGNVTSINEFPWMGLLGYNFGDDKTIDFRCGASLISKRYVLTAAHCTTDLPEGLNLVSVRLGDHDISQERDCDFYDNGIDYYCADEYQDFGIERFHIHPNFSGLEVHNDIALLRLDAEVNFGSPNIRPVCLPLGKAAVMTAQEGVVTGWGLTESGRRSNILLKVNLPIVDEMECRQIYKPLRAMIWHKQICAGGVKKLDSCSGDSGGPLQAIGNYMGQRRTVIYGIVSFGPKNCGIDGYPGVYTKVPYYVDWILDTMTD